MEFQPLLQLCHCTHIPQSSISNCMWPLLSSVFAICLVGRKASGKGECGEQSNGKCSNNPQSVDMLRECSWSVVELELESNLIPCLNPKPEICRIWSSKSMVKMYIYIYVCIKKSQWTKLEQQKIWHRSSASTEIAVSVHWAAKDSPSRTLHFYTKPKKYVIEPTAADEI